MRRILIISFLLVGLYTMEAQRSGNSPYSRFGIGDITPSNFMHLRHMGYTGTAYADAYHVNVNNPASYAFLKTTGFDIGLQARRAILTEGDTQSDPIWSGNLDYLSLAFPLQNDLNQLLDREYKPYRFGMGFTLAPASNVSYNIETTDTDPTDGSIRRAYTGEGGSYKFLWSTGFKYKDFAVGTNLGYQFGNISYERQVYFDDLPFAYDNFFSNKYSMSGFLFDVGALYTLVLNKQKNEDNRNTPLSSLTFGLTYNGGSSLSTNSEISNIAVQKGVGLIDTAQVERDIKGSAKLPGKLSLGINYKLGTKFMVGLDYSQSSWSNYFNEATGEVKETLKNTSAVSFGGYYRPNYNSYTSYWKRIYYRYGFYNRTDPREINGQQINSYAVTLGLGLPFVFQRKISHANIGVELGKRGSGTVIEETFLQLSLGFTFNDDEWFIKRKYN